MNDLLVRFVVATLALVGFALIVWALIEFFDNHVGGRIRAWMTRDHPNLGVEDGVMHVLRSKAAKPAGLYCRWEPGTVKRRPLPVTTEDVVYPFKVPRLRG